MPKTFYIIDGHAQIYRAYFAPFRDLTSPTGEPTRATFVFTQMLLNLVEKRKPDYLAMVIDDVSEVAVFRREIHPEYKANRKSRPDDFNPQEERILRIVRDAGVPIFVQPAFEADDVIATMATQLKDQDFEIFLVSKDKDLRQLLNNHTKMYDPATDDVMDPAAMEAKLGYTPAEAIDVQTLMGDSTDNVPGVPGVGEKTAVKLIKQYGTAAAVLDHLSELTPKLRENFVAFTPNIDKTRRLVTLERHVKMEFDPEKCRMVGLNVPAIKKHLSELGFTSLLKRLGGEEPAPVAKPSAEFSDNLFSNTESKPVEVSTAQTAADGRYHLVNTREKFETFLAELRKQKRIAFDTETDDLGPMCSNLVGISISWMHGTGYYIPVRGPSGESVLSANEVLKSLKPILENPAIHKVGHNIKYDLLVMRCAGIEMKGIVLDSMIAAFLLDAGRMQYGIDKLALEMLNFRKIATSELIGKGGKQIRMDQVDLSKIATYASEDADIALRLADLLSPKLDAIPALRKLADELETPLIDVLAEMEFNGIAVDPVILKEQSAVLGERIEALHKKIMEAAGCDFNPDSPKQLADVLFQRLALPTGKKTKTGFSTDVQVLEKLAASHPVPRMILDYRGMMKLKNTYLDSLTELNNERTGRIHGSFNQAGASTGRLSMSDPNLQNIPIRTDEGRRIRLAFVPGDREKNVLLTADYSQIELRFLAHFTQEPALIKAFEEDEDIHTAVAAEVYGVPLDQVSREQRGSAKTINFGIVYGVSAFGLSSRIEGLTTKAAQELIDSYHRRFPSIEKFTNAAIAHAQQHGYVETILGRRRPVSEINSQIIAQRRGAERAAGNGILQGSAADLIKMAMLNIHRRIRREGMHSRMLLQVHDELVFETPAAVVEKEAEIIREEMVGAMKIAVPLKVEVGWGKNWQEVK